ncbi:MAG TPA: acyltransferase [Intrasporangium sp.]|jgi:peptidoglycan/LPS O-acetylase OafA/YrhL|uniref:acyltransferase family protein n=1 Tax=Intrasporangium sp. TaxID=1925024 RepID=UPI002F95977F
MTTDVAAGRRRLLALDGLRGVAIALVVLSHGWALWPLDSIKGMPFIGLFRAGNIAVTVFFVIGGYLLTRSLLAEVERTGRLTAGQAALRRLLRISAHVYALLIALAIVHAVDETDVYPGTSLRQSIVRVASYTWNWFLLDNALVARPDLGHLWYISVYVHVTLLLILVVWVLRKYRLALVAVLAVLSVSLFAWRLWVVENEDLFSALLRTTTRMDAMVLGALVAAALPWIRRWSVAAAPVLLPVSMAALAVLIMTTGHDESYFRWPGLVINLAAVAFVVGVLHARGNPAFLRPLEWRPLVALGSASMAIYIWHFPVFWAVARHSSDWSWQLRTGVGFAITAVAVLVAQRVVETPLQKWLMGRFAQSAPAERQPRREPHEVPGAEASEEPADAATSSTPRLAQD